MSKYHYLSFFDAARCIILNKHTAIHKIISPRSLELKVSMVIVIELDNIQ